LKEKIFTDEIWLYVGKWKIELNYTYLSPSPKSYHGFGISALKTWLEIK
jgi:hypothetical protein